MIISQGRRREYDPEEFPDLIILPVIREDKYTCRPPIPFKSGNGFL
jgi:hypothetical protein